MFPWKSDLTRKKPTFYLNFFEYRQKIIDKRSQELYYFRSQGLKLNFLIKIASLGLSYLSNEFPLKFSADQICLLFRINIQLLCNSRTYIQEPVCHVYRNSIIARPLEIDNDRLKVWELVFHASKRVFMTVAYLSVPSMYLLFHKS